MLLLARRACLAEVGLFDERYFAYCEEADLALRALIVVGLALSALLLLPATDLFHSVTGWSAHEIIGSLRVDLSGEPVAHGVDRAQAPITIIDDPHKNREEADSIKAQLEEAGAKVSLS